MFDNCENCVHGYVIAHVAEIHELCGAGHCYLCMLSSVDKDGNVKCDDYERGSVPIKMTEKGYEIIS